jgi:FAD:protein FMN transferase
VTAFLLRETFRAMGTACAVAVATEPASSMRARGAIVAAGQEVAACERALSRFDDASDLSRLNRQSGSWVVVDERLIEALEAAIRLRVSTRGRFDPTILRALIAVGYDRTFERLTNRRASELGDWSAGARIDVDPSSSRARVERGATVDLGGLGKGFAASRALDAVRRTWPENAGALLDLGGDIAVWGAPPEGGPWLVDIADPGSPERKLGTLRLDGGGVATSGPGARRFGPGRELHHLIDPDTGRPAGAGPRAVTVVAPTATEAEAYATALAVTHFDDAHRVLELRPDLAALLVPRSGAPVSIGHLPLRAPRPRFVVTAERGRFACR